jgi:VWFA-related protein
MCGALGTLSTGVLGGQQPSFRGTVELIVADVQVVDRTGEPIRNLTPGQFQASVGGRPQRVVSADYLDVSLRVEPDATPGGTGRPPDSGQAAPTDRERMFIMAIDVMSFPPALSQTVMQAAKQFVSQLGADDLVGVFPYPGGFHVNPTNDRALVFAGLEKVIGRRGSPSASRFRIRPSELLEAGVDMLNTVGTDLAPLPPQSEALLVRECGPRNQEGIDCWAALRHEVLSEVALSQTIAEQSVGALQVLMGALAAVPGRKTVVVVTAGMLTTDRPGARPNVNELSLDLGEQAARANATVYTVFVDAQFMERNNAEHRGGDFNEFVTYVRDSELLSSWYDLFSASAGGTMITDLLGRGEIGFRRVLRETSGYYRLGIDVAGVDRNGRRQPIRVRVDVDDATVRGRAWVIVPRRAS